MDLMDRLALAGRRFERRHSSVNGGVELSLDEVLRVMHGKTILEIAVKAKGNNSVPQVHDPDRPVSLLDHLAEADGGQPGSYEVFQTAPSGDHSRVRIVCRPSGGEVHILAGRRVPEHMSDADPALDALHSRIANS